MDLAVKLSYFVTEEQFYRIFEWNKERNDLKYDKTLESDMFFEEIEEFYAAGSTVDRLDAFLDTLFVGVGSIIKSSRDRTARNFSEFFENTTFFDTMVSIMFGDLVEKGVSEDDILDVIQEGLTEVINANFRKGTKKNAAGKIQKPKDFIGPEKELQRIIDSYVERKKENLKDGEQLNKGAIEYIGEEEW